MSDPKTRKFPGSQIDVEWDGRLCIHMAECGQANNELFVGGRDPWGQPDRVSLEEVIDVVKRCPTGALTFEAKEAAIVEKPDEENTVTVTYNGPYFVRGDIDIDDAPTDMPGVAFRATLCRCGQSKNKPFCDNSHEQANFKDYGAVGDKGEAVSAKGGKLTVKSLKDGPLLLAGNITIINGSGRVAWSGTQAALCRCGASQNKPFCDGSHKAAGFKG